MRVTAAWLASTGVPAFSVTPFFLRLTIDALAGFAGADDLRFSTTVMTRCTVDLGLSSFRAMALRPSPCSASSLICSMTSGGVTYPFVMGWAIKKPALGGLGVMRG